MEGEEVMPRPTKYRCGRCAYARMSENKILNPHKEVDECHHNTLKQPTRICALRYCPKRMQKLFVKE